jgi:hypothetical protein
MVFLMGTFLMQEGDEGLVNGGVAAKMPRNVSDLLEEGEEDTDDFSQEEFASTILGKPTHKQS